MPVRAASSAPTTGRGSKTPRRPSAARSGVSHKITTPSNTQDSNSSAGEPVVEDGYIPMIWTDEAGIQKTTQMLLYIKDNEFLRRSLYPKPGDESTGLKHTQVHLQIAEHLLKNDASFRDAYPRLKGKYGRAIKARLHKLYEIYVQKRGSLSNSGAGLSNVDRFRYPDVKNLPELVRKVFPWYDLMDEFVHERAALGLDSLVNSDDQADLSVVGWGQAQGLNAARGAAVKRSETFDTDAPVRTAAGEAQAMGCVGAGVSPVSLDKDEQKVTNENDSKTRNNRVPPIDMTPIEAAIRDGDELREKGKKEQLEFLMSKKEAEKERNREAKERRAEAEREYKLKREEFRLNFARDKIELEIKAKEAETKLIEAQIKETEVQMLARGRDNLGREGGGTGGSVGNNEEYATSGGLRNLKRIWE